MRRRLAEVRSLGADVAVVGSGSPDHARDFVEKTGLDVRIYCDRDVTAYKIARLKRGKLRTLGPRAALNAVRTLVRGFTPGKVQGDPYQQGGVLVITRAGEIIYHHAAEVAGEALPLDEILDAVRRARA